MRCSSARHIALRRASHSPLVPIDVLSETPIMLNRQPTIPASVTPSLVSSARSSRCMSHGFPSNHTLKTPTCVHAVPSDKCRIEWYRCRVRLANLDFISGNVFLFTPHPLLKSRGKENSVKVKCATSPIYSRLRPPTPVDIARRIGVCPKQGKLQHNHFFIVHCNTTICLRNTTVRRVREEHKELSNTSRPPHVSQQRAAKHRSNIPRNICLKTGRPPWYARPSYPIRKAAKLPNRGSYSRLALHPMHPCQRPRRSPPLPVRLCTSRRS